MKRFSSRRTTRYAALLLTLVGGAVIVVASAQATPTKKNVNAFVIVASAQSNCTQPLVGQCFEVHVQNDGSSNVTLGSTNFTAPTGWAVNSAVVTDASGHSWSACGGNGTTCGAGNVVELRANSSGDALAAGQSVTAYADVSTNCAASGNSALWSQETKQANNFSGQPGNDFLGKSLDLNPLGSFSVTTDIPSIVDRSATPSVTWTVSAQDTCGQTKAAGAAPGQAAYRGTTPYSDSVTKTGLTGAGFNPALPSGLSWGASSGVGTITVTPNTSEAGNQLTETDTPTGISTSSQSFVVVDELCTKTNGKPCSVNDGQYHNGSVTTTLSTPNGTNPNKGSLGLGFDPSLDTTGCVQGAGQLGEKMFIFPSGIVGTYQVTITLTKAAVGKAPTSSLYICFKGERTVGTNGWIVLQNCSNTVSDPCIVSRSGTSGGGVQFVLSLAPGDPSPVIHH